MEAYVPSIFVYGQCRARTVTILSKKVEGKTGYPAGVKKKKIIRGKLFAEEMGRTIYAEKHLRTYLASLAKPDGYVIGLILGQVRFSVSSNFSGRMSRSRFNICDKHKK